MTNSLQIGDYVMYKDEMHRVIHIFETDSAFDPSSRKISHGMLGKINIQRVHGRPSYPRTVSKDEVKWISANE